MPNLKWYKPNGSRILQGSTVHSKSTVRLQGRGYSQNELPTKFFVWRGYGNLGTRFLQRRNKPTTKLIDDVGAIPASSTSVISEDWIVPTFGLRVHVPLQLVDDLGNPSPHIFASTLGGLKIGPSVQVGGFGAGLGSGDFTTAIDPVVGLRCLLPWETDSGGLLGPLIEEIAADINPLLEEDDATTLGELKEFIKWAIPMEPLEKWSFNLPEGPFEMDDGQNLPFNIEIYAPNPGITAFAIEARSLGLDAEGQEQVVASDIFVVEMDYDGVVEILTL